MPLLYSCAQRCLPIACVCRPRLAVSIDDRLEEYFQTLRKKRAVCFRGVIGKEPGEGRVSGAQGQLMLSGLILNSFSTCTRKAISMSLKSELDVGGGVLFPCLRNSDVGLHPPELS